jgi:N-formylglutamate amidohydrolase
VVKSVLVHVPHASDVVPSDEAYLIDTRVERNIVTDWYTDDLITADQSIVFPFSRVYCDVERFEDDPLDAVGQGVYYTKTLAGGALRVKTDASFRQVMALYHGHHRALVAAIQTALVHAPVCLVDAHSYSDYQARMTGHAERPDICLGTDPDHTPTTVVEQLEALFTEAGYSVALNRPYAGTMIPQTVRGHRDFSALMVEINKRVYLTDGDARAVPEPSQGYASLKQVLGEAMEIIRRT